MGVVYRAEDPAIGRTVAVKTIHLDAQSDASARLKREAQLAGILSHPNIVTIYDILEEGNQAHIFMEFVDGPTLETLMTRGEAIPPPQAIAWLEQIADALDFAHAKGVVHRDIKPANIMIQQGRTAKVTDFGVARIQTEATTGGATIEGALQGTPTYMAPEQIESQRVDGRADQFALAVLAYELLTGERPFVSPSIAGLMYKIVHDDPAPASRVNATLSEDASDVLAKALHKHRDQRYATCAAFVCELREALERKAGWRLLPRGASESLPTIVPEPVPVIALPPPRAVKEEEAPRPRRPWIPVGALAALAIAAGAGWFFWRPLQLAAPAVRVQPPPAPVLPTPAPAVVTPAPVAATPVEVTPPTQTTTPPGEEPAETGPQMHLLRIETTPPLASITIDGSERGCPSPCEIRLPAGTHRIAAARDGYRTEVRTVEVPQEGPVTFQLTQMTGTLFVQSSPAGATVLINGRVWPQKTPTRLTLGVGRHKLEVALEGQVKEEREVEIREGAVASINVDWNTQKQ